MGSIEAWTSFFGWCTVLNIGIYVLTIVALMSVRNFVTGFNAKIFAIGADDVKRDAFRYVANYKLAITLFCFVPWLALTLMA